MQVYRSRVPHVQSLVALTTIAWAVVVIAAHAPRLKSSPTSGLVQARHGMVVSVSPEASDAGLAILERGGNAVDAAVASALALTVTYPAAGNIGGGGFMLVWPGEGEEPVCVDYRETAPASATRDMFVTNRVPTSHKAVGVPGTPRGRWPWRTSVGENFPGATWWHLPLAWPPTDSRSMLPCRSISAQCPPDRQQVPSSAASLCHPDGTKWHVGDRLVQPDLARTLQLLADDGPDAFYAGSIARSIVAEMQAGGGLITVEDLSGYTGQNTRARRTAPIEGSTSSVRRRRVPAAPAGSRC